MKQISSNQNPILKKLKMLQSSTKYRREVGQTFLEGIHLADSFLKAGLVPEYCVVSEDSIENSEVQQIIDQLDEMKIGSVSLSASQFRAISSVEHGIGIGLVISIPTVQKLDLLVENSLLIDDVQDPGNLGAILRTAAAAGVSKIYCSQATTSAWSPKVLRAAMGAHFGLEIFENVELADTIQNSKIPIYATTLSGQTTLYDTDLKTNCAWLFGNEGQGVSSQLLEQNNVTEVSIPQHSQVESLNVAAAVAVCLFEQRRQQMASQRV